jgi:hypothetical protein
MFIDPTGNIAEDHDEAKKAFDIVTSLRAKYNIAIAVDWGYHAYDTGTLTSLIPEPGSFNYGQCWHKGRWDLKELELVEFTFAKTDLAMRGKYRSLVGPITISKVLKTCGKGCTKQGGSLIELEDRNMLPTNPNMSLNIINDKINFDARTIAHETGHAWDLQHHEEYSQELQWRTGGITFRPLQYLPQCINDAAHRLPGCNDVGYYFGGIPLYGGGSNFNALEDFANSFLVYVFPTETGDDVRRKYDKTNGIYKDYSQYYYWTSNDLRSNPRWLYVDELINGSSKP